MINIASRTKQRKLQISIPKFKIESKLDGQKVLEKLGVKNVFTDSADLTKVSSKSKKVDDLENLSDFMTTRPKQWRMEVEKIARCVPRHAFRKQRNKTRKLRGSPFLSCVGTAKKRVHVANMIFTLFKR